MNSTAKKRKRTSDEKKASDNDRAAEILRKAFEGIDAACVFDGAAYPGPKGRAVRKLDAFIEKLVTERNFIAAFIGIDQRAFGPEDAGGEKKA
jgi:hypothetical protein